MRFFNRFLCLALALSVVAPSSALAVDEAQYDAAYDNEVLPWARQFPIQYMTGKKGISLAYICFEKPGATDALLIATGRTEPSNKYFEVAYDLYHSELALSVCVYDHRGQGFSGRLLSDVRKGHVDWFDYYAQDLKRVVNRVRSMGYSRVYGLGHSMGGGVAVYASQKYSNLFDGLVLTAPMLGVNTDPYPNAIAYAVVAAMVWFWQGDEFLMGKTYWVPDGSDEAFNENYVTRSKTRWMMNENLYLELGDEYPQEPLGGGTNRWLRECLRAGWKMSWYARSLRVPTLLFQAADEKYVKKSSQDYICRKAANCEMVRFDDARYADAEGRMPRHELLMETDDVRNEVLGRTLDFLRDLGVPTTSIGQFNQAVQQQQQQAN